MLFMLGIGMMPCASACGKISDLHLWWDQLLTMGLPYGYFPNASKTWLVVKECYLDHVKSLFADTCVNVTSDGRPHLGAAIGSAAYITQYVSGKITTWVQELKCYLPLLPMQLMLLLFMD